MLMAEISPTKNQLKTNSWWKD